MISCKELTRLASEGYDRQLRWVERWQMWLHLQACRACPRFVRQLEFLHAAAKRYREGP
jgi:hypothetical protein